MSAHADESLAAASDSVADGDYGRAFAHFLLALTLDPSIKEREGIEELFVDCLRSWSAKLVSLQRNKDALWCHEQASDVWPESGGVLHATGQFLYQSGYRHEGISFLKRACHVAPHPDWLWDLQNAASSLVERWHFRMLNDRSRNQAYFDALKRAVDSGHKKILDIGSGTGILSMLAVSAGAKGVTACEMDTVLCDLSKLIIAKNSMEEHISLENVKSTDMNLQSEDERFTLVVTEIADAGLLGEGLIPTLQHAWEHLLQPRDHTSEHASPSQVIPAGATVYVQIIESSYIRRRHRVIHGNAVLSSMPVITSKCSPLRFDPSDPAKDVDTEPYSSETLNQIPGGWRLLSDPHQVYHFNFCDAKILTEDHLRQKTLSIPVTSIGRADAVVSWFELHIDYEATVSSSPDSGSCWEQAVYPIPGDQQGAVDPGDTIDITCQCHPTWMSFSASITNGRKSKTNSSSNHLTDQLREPESDYGKTARQDAECGKDGLAECTESTTLHDCPGDQLAGHKETCGCSIVQETGSDKDFVDRSSGGIAPLDNVHTKPCTVSVHEHRTNCDRTEWHETECDENALKLSGENELVTDNNGTISTSDQSKEGKENCVTPAGQDTKVGRDGPRISSMDTASCSNDSCKSHYNNQMGKHRGCHPRLPERGDECSQDILRISSKDVALLNDEKYLEFIQDSFTHCLNQTNNAPEGILMGRTNTGSKAVILDRTGIGLTGVLSDGISIPREYLVHVTSAADSKLFVDEMIKRNPDSLRNYRNIIEDGGVGEANNVRIVVSDLVDASGVLKENALEDLYMACGRSPVSKVHVIPGVVRVHAVCVESDELRRNTRVTGTAPSLGLDVTLINEYKTSTQLDVCLSKLTHRQITEHFVAFNINHLMKDRNPLGVFAQKRDSVVKVQDGGRISSVVYWFEIGSGEGDVISTLDEDTHWLQAAFMLDEDIVVQRGDEIRITSSLRNDALSFTVNLTDDG